MVPIPSTPDHADEMTDRGDQITATAIEASFRAQVEKAVDRFKTIIAQKPGIEPYFYLAESYKQLGMKQEAIAAYEKCKTMMPDPTFDQKIDGYIKELKN